MNIDKLSLRLQTVAKYIPEGSRVADIGSDHAYLPSHLVKKGIASFAIAGEVVEGPFQSARKQVEMEGLTDNISVRKGDGLEVLSAEEVECITIAGMGGALITSILDKGKEKLLGVKRLVLQPNIGAKAIREWLIEHGWELVQEEIVEEDGKIYEILVADRGDGLKPYHDLDKRTALLLGPFLAQEKSAPFEKKWRHELENWQRILKQLEAAGDTKENQEKREELQGKIKMVEEVINS